MISQREGSGIREVGGRELCSRESQDDGEWQGQANEIRSFYWRVKVIISDSRSGTCLLYKAWMIWKNLNEKSEVGGSPFSQDDLWLCSSVHLRGDWELMTLIGPVHNLLLSTEHWAPSLCRAPWYALELAPYSPYSSWTPGLSFLSSKKGVIILTYLGEWLGNPNSLRSLKPFC